MKASYLIKLLLGTLFFFAILFVSAGRIDYWQGLTYVSIGLMMLILSFTVLRIDPELLKERAKPGKDTKQWDKTILGLSFLVTISMYIIAGLDSGRYHWSPDFHWSIYSVGDTFNSLGAIVISYCPKAEPILLKYSQDSNRQRTCGM